MTTTETPMELVYCAGYTTKDGIRVACPRRMPRLVPAGSTEGKKVRCGPCSGKHHARATLLRLSLFKRG